MAASKCRREFKLSALLAKLSVVLERKPASRTVKIHRLEAEITSDSHRELAAVIPRTGSVMNSLPLCRQLEIPLLTGEAGDEAGAARALYSGGNAFCISIEGVNSALKAGNIRSSCRNRLRCLVEL